MKILKLLIGLILIVSSGFAQNQIIKTIELSSGMTFFDPPMWEQLRYDAYFNETYPINLTTNIEFHPFKKIGIKGGIGARYERLNVFYKNYAKLDSMTAEGENPQAVYLHNAAALTIHDRTNVFSIIIPIELKYYVFKRVFLSGGFTPILNLNKRSYHKIELEKKLGIGANYNKWGWSISVSEPWGMSGIRMLNNTHPYGEFNDYLVYNKRSLTLGLQFILQGRREQHL